MAEKKLQMEEAFSDGRVIQGWALGKTLGKGGYSWVKAGRHEETGKMYALKFLGKEKKSRAAEEQTQQVQTEIEVLKRVNHRNIIKLYAYNLNCPYTKSDKTVVDTIMLVLEMATGGELFDILFYTKALPAILARTYFYQLMEAVQHLHEKGVTHRDLKPQNMLLDENFNLKVTDFGLSKVHTTPNKVMSTTYVGTKGYQAPELLMNRRYTNAMDVFSCGVILFIMMTGYPPFEQSDPQNDPWYKYIATGRYAKFWKKHRDCGVPDGAKPIIEKMVTYQPLKRAKVQDVLDDAWVNDKRLEASELANAIREIHTEACLRKKNDKRKQEMLNHSNRRNLKIEELPDLERLDVLDAGTTLVLKEKISDREVEDVLLNIQKLLRGTDLKKGFFGRDENNKRFNYFGEADMDDEKWSLECRLDYIQKVLVEEGEDKPEQKEGEDKPEQKEGEEEKRRDRKMKLEFKVKVRKTHSGIYLAVFKKAMTVRKKEEFNGKIIEYESNCQEGDKLYKNLFGELMFQLRNLVAEIASPKHFTEGVKRKKATSFSEESAYLMNCMRSHDEKCNDQKVTEQ